MYRERTGEELRGTNGTRIKPVDKLPGFNYAN
jgi:hypothetical protein